MKREHVRFSCRTATALGLAAGLLAASVATAGPIQGRQNVQDARIDQGVASGEITKREQAVLRGEQQAIDRARDRAIANDGKITKGEARTLTRAQNSASADIHRAKHNARDAK